MKKKSAKLESEINGVKEKAQISIDFPSIVPMRFIPKGKFGQNLLLSRRNNRSFIQPPVFQGVVRIPVKLHRWKPRSKYVRIHHGSLRVDNIQSHVGTAPFTVKAMMIGHFFESDYDVDIELIVKIESWLMSPELLNNARLEFSLTLIGEEHNSTKSFYANIGAPNSETVSVNLPVWSRTQLDFATKFKLKYDISEFENNVRATLTYHLERLEWVKQQLQLLDVDMISSIEPEKIDKLDKLLPKEDKEMLSLSLIDQIIDAHYISNPIRQLAKNYRISANKFKSLSQDYFQILQEKTIELQKRRNDKAQSILSQKFQQRLDIFQRVIKTYEEISLEKLSRILEFETPELELWLLRIAPQFSCFKIKNHTLTIDHNEVDPALLNKLEEKFLEWEFFERQGKLEQKDQF